MTAWAEVTVNRLESVSPASTRRLSSMGARRALDGCTHREVYTACRSIISRNMWILPQGQLVEAERRGQVVLRPWSDRDWGRFAGRLTSVHLLPVGVECTVE
jgi:hypothetical protein